MCGVFGAIKKFDADKVRLMGILNVDRGSHGAGMFDKENLIKFSKDYKTLTSQGGYEFVEDAKDFIVGHTRYATHGAKTNKNCHPFKFGDVVGVHNGQIRNFEELKKKYKQKKLKVDSQIIFYLLNKKGIKGLNELIGYYTIIWYDKRKPEVVNILQHECDLAYYKGKDAFYFSSDVDDLELAIGYDKKVIESIENTWYQINIDTLKIKQTKIKGLKKDTGFNIAKTKGGYLDSNVTRYTSYSDDSGYWDDKAQKWIDYSNRVENDYPNELNQTNDTFSYNNDVYFVKCPECNEYLSLDEINTRSCGICREELSGEIYECEECENYMLLEDLVKKESEECIFCDGKLKEYQTK